MLPEIGKKAPSFKLSNQDGIQVSSDQFIGEKNIVFYFYPKAMTPGCTIQACGIRDSEEEFEQLDTIVLGVSPDSPQKLTRFIEKKDLNFTLLSDEGNKTAKAYGAYGEKKFMGRKYMGIHRMTFIIGKDGKLKHIMKKVDTKNHHNDVIQFIKENL